MHHRCAQLLVRDVLEQVTARAGAHGRRHLVGVIRGAEHEHGGLEATRRLLARYPEATVLMLSAADDPDEVAAAVGSGARGYLLKDVSHEELCTAVVHALDGNDLVGTAMRQAMTIRRNRTSRTLLTERELQVLRGMSRGRSNAQIGRELFLSEDTVKTHARRLFRKLEVSDRAQAVALGFRRGWVS